MRVTVDRVEALGVSLLAHFTVDAPPVKTPGVAAATGAELEDAPLLDRRGAPFCATFEPRSGVRVGEVVDVELDARRFHFFDPETETAVAAGSE
jgi:hypothetical protein